MDRTRCALVALWCAGVAAPAASPQGMFQQFHGTAAGDRLGAAIAGVGDLDHDGRDDYATGAPYEPVNGGAASGVVRVISGATGQALRVLQGDSHGGFGFAIAGLGDVDLDGTPDLIVGAPEHGGPAYAGMARVYSGATGGILHTFHGDKAYDLLGSTVSGTGDLDQDGHADFALDLPRTFSESGVYPSNTPGQVRVYSGFAGALLYTWNGNAGADAYGTSLSGGKDVNGDGIPDLLVGAWGPEAGTGNAWVRSGKDGSVLHHVQGTYPGQNFGFWCDLLEDVDGDGRADFAVGAPGWDAVLAGWPVPGEARVYSGSTAAELFRFSGTAGRDLFGSSLANLGDATGDGIPDLAVAASPFDPLTGVYQDAYVRVISLADGSVLHTYAADGATPFDLVALVAAAGDVNGDGFGDLLVGSHVDGDTGYEAGQVDVLWVANEACGSFQSYGSPCSSGAGFAPVLSLAGCPTAGGYVTLEVSNGPPSGAALIALGLAPAQLPVGAGCSWYLGQTLPAILGPLPLKGYGPGQGSFALTAMLPHGTPPFVLHHQAIVIDASAALGFTTSNAVKEAIE